MKLLTMTSLTSLCLLTFVEARSNASQEYRKATFAGGCFWCMTPPFENLPGVVKITSGYIGGAGAKPTYENYTEKGFIEAVQIAYDPSKITYAQLLDVFWRQIDPTDTGGQFVDRGPQYRTAVFYHDEEQKELAEKSKEELGKSGRYHRPIVTEIILAPTFYAAEEYHQDFHKKSPGRYQTYRSHAGRDQYLEKTWGREKAANDLSTNASKHKKLFNK